MPSLGEFENWCKDRQITGFSLSELQTVYDDVLAHRKAKGSASSTSRSKPEPKPETSYSRPAYKETRSYGK